MKIYVINLNRRTDRLVQMEEQAKRLGFEFERLEAIEGTGTGDWKNTKLSQQGRGTGILSPGAHGCFLSHKAILERRETCLVLEDDALLVKYFNDKLDWCMDELPTDWDMFYLGGWKQDVEKYSSRLQRANRVLCTHAYMITASYCDRLLAEMKGPDKVDLIYARTPGNKFIANEVLATQREGFSDIENRITNNIHLK